MTPGLRVLSPGLLTTVQDAGRVGYQRLGIAVSGALDSFSLRAANALAGNPLGMGALEVAYVGPTLQVDAEQVRLAFVGAHAEIDILPDASATDAQRIEPMRSIRLRRGEVVRIGSLSDGAVLYIAIEGGFDIAPVLGSVSTYIRGGFGGWHGRALRTGDRVPLRCDRTGDREDCRFDGLDLSRPPRFRAVVGPQRDLFSDREIATFFASEFTVSADSDRVGMRLCGAQVHDARGVNMTSDGIAPGSIQVPGSGQPIVLLADRQTTGGYPKIATVISADLPALGRVPIGAKIAFEPITVDAAQALRREHADEIGRICDRIVPIDRDATEIAPLLLDSNLISGVVDAQSWRM
jgi:biotin-dependent carboxylase-like uncharacterized protein